MYVRACTFASVFILTLAHSQKVVKKTLTNPKSKAFEIDAAHCYQVNLSTTDHTEIMVLATIDGEYQKDLLATIKEEGSNVIIRAGFSPNFIDPNDKLSAHKAIAIALDISLPKNVDVAVFGTQANIAVKGLYKNLTIQLSDGDCWLDQVGETVMVKTQKGNIYLRAKSGQIKAKSKYGKVYGKAAPFGGTTYELYSVQGDIHLISTK